VPTTIDLAALIAAYDVTESSTFYMTCTCQADYTNGNLVIVCEAGRPIATHDWDDVLDHFGFHPEFYDVDFAVLDGLDFFLLTEVEP
jgi:hypothetical protein